MCLALEREIQRKLLQTDLFILFKTRINIVLTFFLCGLTLSSKISNNFIDGDNHSTILDVF